jgi:type IV secretion system protein VirD4
MAMNQKNESARFAGSILLAFAMAMTGTSWVATQYFASAVGYADGLGEFIMAFGGGIRLYQPFSWWFWNLQWINERGVIADHLFRVHIIVVTGAILSVVLGMFMAYRRSLRRQNTDDLKGTARWATEADIQRMKLMSFENRTGALFFRKIQRYVATGVYIGAFLTKGGLKVLRYNDPAHLLCYAPTRSGKGVGLVLPTLLSYPQSTFANDIKGENYELSSGFRHSAGTLVMRFDPTSVVQKSIDGKTRWTGGVRWNVIDEIRLFTEFDVMDAQNIAAAIADPKGDGMDDHWVSTSYELLVGVILHVAYVERLKSLAGVAVFLADPTFTDPEQMYNDMLNAEHDPDGVMGWEDSAGRATKTHPAVAISARAMLNKEEKERNSVLSTAKTRLSLYTEPIVARNIAKSDFRIRDLMNHEKAVSFYLVVPPSDKERLRPLLRLFVTFMLRSLTSKMEFMDGESVKDYRHRLLLLIDELPSLKKLEQLQDALSYMAGYGITAYLFVQDTIQLEDVYGDKETISAGCQLQIAFAPNTLETATKISKKTGVSTRKKQSVSYSGNRMGSMLGQMSLSEEEVERNLLTEDEVTRLPRDELLIFNTGHPPIRGQKLFYYKMPEFKRRASMPTPCRIEMTYSDDADKLHGNWFMALCERIQKSNNFALTINCYSDYPPVRVLVKQETIAGETLLEIEYQLREKNGAPVQRALTIDDLKLTLAPIGDVSQFDPNEAYEVHFSVADITPYTGFSQAGFYRDMSIYERDVRRQVKDFFYKLEEKEGKPIDLRFEKIEAGGKYSGFVMMETEKYIVLQKNRDADRDLISLHRKEKLDRHPALNAFVQIRYTGKKGAVQ